MRGARPNDNDAASAGLDVHKASLAVAIAEEEGAPSSYGNIANDPSAIRR
jgi:hypothetical protein